MKICGIVAEFNPFHNGHAYLVQKAREMGATHVVAVMSGNFVQRGEPAIFDVKTRTEAALKGGVDLIISLPVTRSVARAQDFAGGALEILKGLGCVDMLAFGSERGEIAPLEKAAEILEKKELDALIKVELEKGLTYAVARENAVRIFSQESADILKYPNNILAVEYISAAKKIRFLPKLVTVKRQGVAHDSTEISGDFAGAKQIRKMVKKGENFAPLVPVKYPDTEELNIVNTTKFDTAVLYKMRTVTLEDLRKIQDVSEGIENRILSAVQESNSLEELYENAKTKRYPEARIRRIVLQSALGITAEDIALKVPYIRLLGATEKGLEIACALKKTATLPVVSKTADFKDLGGRNAQKIFDLEITATDIYSLCREKTLPCGEEKKFTFITI